LILIDANLLLYAYHPGAAEHQRSREWLEKTLNGPDLVRFSWLTLWAFIRIGTNPRVFERPLSVAEADSIVSSWLSRPNAGVVEPGERHWQLLRGLLCEGQTTGPLVMDAVLAAIAKEHGATLCTTDRDFSRFPGLKWQNPLSAGEQ
jgi:toxin-antitoxin system PIN domain toxin